MHLASAEPQPATSAEFHPRFLKKNIVSQRSRYSSENQLIVVQSANYLMHLRHSKLNIMHMPHNISSFLC